MPFDLVAAGLELGKAAGSAIAGFYVGRNKERRDKVLSTVKDTQQKTVALIRTTVSDAIRHFSHDMDPTERIASATLLKANIKRITTDANHLAMAVDKTSAFYFDEFELLHTAITAEPFESVAVAPNTIDHQRIDRISSAGEALVTVIYHIDHSF